MQIPIDDIDERVRFVIYIERSLRRLHIYCRQLTNYALAAAHFMLPSEYSECTSFIMLANANGIWNIVYRNIGKYATVIRSLIICSENYTYFLWFRWHCAYNLLWSIQTTTIYRRWVFFSCSPFRILNYPLDAELLICPLCSPYSIIHALHSFMYCVHSSPGLYGFASLSCCQLAPRPFPPYISVCLALHKPGPVPRTDSENIYKNLSRPTARKTKNPGCPGIEICKRANGNLKQFSTPTNGRTGRMASVESYCTK